VNFVDEHKLAVGVTADLILGIREEEAILLGNGLAKSEKRESRALGEVPFVGGHDAASDYLLGGDGLVAGVALGGWSDNGLRKAVVLAEAVGERVAAE
jgi:hypothetical protein